MWDKGFYYRGTKDDVDKINKDAARRVHSLNDRREKGCQLELNIYRNFRFRYNADR